MAGPMTFYSNIPPELYRPSVPTPPSLPLAPSLWDVYRQLKEPEKATPVQSAVTGLRHNAEGGFVGAILGFIHGEFGTLDVRGKYPVDGIAAALLYAMSVRDSNKPDGYASDLRALSVACTTTVLYRKTREWREQANRPSGHHEACSSAKDTPILGRSTSATPGNSQRTIDPITEAGKRLLREQEK